MLNIIYGWMNIHWRENSKNISREQLPNATHSKPLLAISIGNTDALYIVYCLIKEQIH